MRERLARLCAQLNEKKLDAVLITSAVNMRYLCGFTSCDATLLVTLRDMVLFTDFRYLIQAKEQTGGLCAITEINRTNLYERLADALGERNVASCGFEQDVVSYSQYKRFSALPITLKPFGNELAELRLVKTGDETALLQKAQSIADQAYAAFLSRVKPGMTELEAVAELNYACSLLGSEEPSFDPIVGSGPNGAMCHAVPGERKLQAGDLVVVDFGCTFGGYRSDMTRTFGVGKISEELRRVYDIVREAQQRALDACKPGVSGAALDAAARDFIAAKGYGDCFGHGLGHGFGLEIHEAPSASMASKDVLRPGMTVTVEPGIYLEGKGGVRIEDCCVLTETGHLNLVHTPKELLIL